LVDRSPSPYVRPAGRPVGTWILGPGSGLQ
jgi:hypothetical protein